MAQYDPWENPGTYDDATWKKLKSLALLESAIEFFFVARSALQVRRLATGSIAPFESEKAITFNFLHSIELGLKAYILRSGETSFDNLKQFRHDLSLLLEECEKIGINDACPRFRKEQEMIIKRMSPIYANAEALRYFAGGGLSKTRIGVLQDTAELLFFDLAHEFGAVSLLRWRDSFPFR